MLDEKTKELVAIGATITANCQPCLEYHTGKAREIGVKEADIAEAIEIGKEIRTGAGAKMDRFAAGVTGARPAHGEARGCGCAT